MYTYMPLDMYTGTIVYSVIMDINFIYCKFVQYILYIVSDNMVYSINMCWWKVNVMSSDWHCDQKTVLQ